MARNKKRPAYLQRLVERTNKQLAWRRVKDANCDLMSVVCDMLLKSDCYKGYSFFKYNDKGNLVLSGTPLCDENGKETYDCIQLF